MDGSKGSLWLAVALLVLSFIALEVTDKVLLSRSGKEVSFSLALSTVKRVEAKDEIKE